MRHLSIDRRVIFSYGSNLHDSCGFVKGYKEFDQYLNSSNPPQSEALFQRTVDAMKQSTRQYAAQQTSAIRNNLLPIINASNQSGGSNDTLFYMLDATGELMPLAT